MTRPPVRSWPNHSRSTEQVPPQEARGLALRREPPESTFYCRELVCCHVQRPQQHASCGFSFYFVSTFPFLWVFRSFLCAVDASLLLSARPRGAMWRYCTDRCASQLCRVWGRSPGPPSRVEMHRRMEIALGTSSFAVWMEELMVVFRDCVDHVDYMSQVDKGTTSRFAQMPAHLPPSTQEYAPERLAGRTRRLRRVTRPNCMPGAHGQASTHQSCPPALSWILPPSLLFLPTCPLPLSIHLMPYRSPLGKWICRGCLPHSEA